MRVKHHEWDYCSYKRDPSKLPSPFQQVRISEKFAALKKVLTHTCWKLDLRLPAS